MEKFKLIIRSIFIIPHFILFKTHKNKRIIKYEVERWLKLTKKKINTNWGFLFLMIYRPEFRNLFYKRIGGVSKIIKWTCPEMNTLFIVTPKIGAGLFLQHGFSTIITCNSIGNDCWINQQVTIGYNGVYCPTIGNNVTINAGAKVIGNVHIGDNSIIGANAVVVKDVPSNCTVVGVPAYIIKKDGIRINEKL